MRGGCQSMPTSPCSPAGERDRLNRTHLSANCAGKSAIVAAKTRLTPDGLESLQRRRLAAVRRSLLPRLDDLGGHTNQAGGHLCRAGREHVAACLAATPMRGTKQLALANDGLHALIDDKKAGCPRRTAHCHAANTPVDAREAARLKKALGRLQPGLERVDWVEEQVNGQARQGAREQRRRVRRRSTTRSLLPRHGPGMMMESRKKCAVGGS